MRELPSGFVCRGRAAGRLIGAVFAVCFAGVAAGQETPGAVGAFPADFLWGTASSPYQVEGGLHQTDWYQWETLCPKCSGDAADDGPAFLSFYQRDLALARSMLNNAIRIGIEWSRIFPTEASFPNAPDAAAVAQYHAVLRQARLLGLNVMVTLQHFDLPIWIQDLEHLDQHAGWSDPATIQKFAIWAAWCAQEYGAEVDWWVTINEPAIVANAGWINGDQPPGHQYDVNGAFTALWHMLFAHAAAYDAIKVADLVDADGDGAPALVSFPHHMRAFKPVNESPDAVLATGALTYIFNILPVNTVLSGVMDVDLNGPDANDPFLPSLAGRLDFVALQYYAMSVVVPVPGSPLPASFQSDLDQFGVDLPKTEFGWAIYPQGLREVMEQLGFYFDGIPIVITENGIADHDDDQRPRYIAEHLRVVAQAITDGIPVHGYFHWSLTDNYELASGFCPRFGLFHVDYTVPGKPRVPGAGAQTYRAIIAAKTVPTWLFEMYPEYPAPTLDCPRQP